MQKNTATIVIARPYGRLTPRLSASGFIRRRATQITRAWRTGPGSGK